MHCAASIWLIYTIYCQVVNNTARLKRQYMVDVIVLLSYLADSAIFEDARHAEFLRGVF